MKRDVVVQGPVRIVANEDFRQAPTAEGETGPAEEVSEGVGGSYVRFLALVASSTTPLHESLTASLVTPSERNRRLVTSRLKELGRWR